MVIAQLISCANNAVAVEDPNETYTTAHNARKPEKDQLKMQTPDETVMCENDDLYEDEDETEEIRKHTVDDVIMHENDDPYAWNK